MPDWNVISDVWFPIRYKVSPTDHSLQQDRLFSQGMPREGHFGALELKLLPASGDPKLSPDQRTECRQLQVKVSAESWNAALAKAQAQIQLFCDQTALSFQSPVRLGHQVVHLAADDTESFSVLDGNQSVMMRKSEFGLNLSRARGYQLNEVDDFSRKQIASLEWYHKALAAQFDVDRFIFFWIALEILFKLDGTEENAPYKAQCGHEIPHCPTCNKSTNKFVMGKSLKSYLIDKCNTDKKTADQLWRFRQVIHGEAENSLEDTAGLCLHLHVAVTSALCRILNMHPIAVPRVTVGAPILSAIALGIRKT